MVTDSKYYDLLGITPDATHDEIKKAYRKLANLYHPDKTDGDKDKEALFISIKIAYECLIDDITRAAYDESGTGGLTTVQMEAKGILSTMFSQAIENIVRNKGAMGDRFHIKNIITSVADIKSLVLENDTKLRKEIAAITLEAGQACDELMRNIDAIQYDGKGQDLFHSVATDMYQAAKKLAKSTISDLEHQIEVNDEVLKMLNDYKDKPVTVASVEFKPGPLENDIYPGGRPDRFRF